MPRSSMDLAIVVNLDYLRLPFDTCRMMWLIVERAMLQAGFELDGREFRCRGGQDSMVRARQVMVSLEPTFESLGFSRLEAVREFYCYERHTRVDLNFAEAVDSVEVEELPDIPL